MLRIGCAGWHAFRVNQAQGNFPSLTFVQCDVFLPLRKDTLGGSPEVIVVRVQIGNEKVSVRIGANDVGRCPARRLVRDHRVRNGLVVWTEDDAGEGASLCFCSGRGMDRRRARTNNRRKRDENEQLEQRASHGCGISVATSLGGFCTGNRLPTPNVPLRQPDTTGRPARRVFPRKVHPERRKYDRSRQIFTGAG